MCRTWWRMQLDSLNFSHPQSMGSWSPLSCCNQSKILLTLRTHCCDNTDTIIQKEGCPASSCMNKLLRDFIQGCKHKKYSNKNWMLLTITNNRDIIQIIIIYSFRLLLSVFIQIQYVDNPITFHPEYDCFWLVWVNWPRSVAFPFSLYPLELRQLMCGLRWSSDEGAMLDSPSVGLNRATLKYLLPYFVEV